MISADVSPCAAAAGIKATFWMLADPWLAVMWSTQEDHQMALGALGRSTGLVQPRLPGKIFDQVCKGQLRLSIAEHQCRKRSKKLLVVGRDEAHTSDNAADPLCHPRCIA
eukprot:CAMPEP_0204119358 /NCGR_PEP_ID=MMETSP0361-20130328/7060_1 /ASSEMBLY_ACC=CAM_ASM_000343 /TAXON_ID=268821 /ORGANISM="Scrippsiella Hangoei, Strain SHTV-5" /LENGTH=109 /DNA_ID=CAMNT_0051070481 /DNA_START=1374 /DNA_END=1703 /DNA_ORIENTATION=-